MMDQLEIRQILCEAGVDYNKGLERFMGNVALYHKFLVKFLDDGSYADFVQAFADGDILELCHFPSPPQTSTQKPLCPHAVQVSLRAVGV